MSTNKIVMDFVKRDKIFSTEFGVEALLRKFMSRRVCDDIRTDLAGHDAFADIYDNADEIMDVADDRLYDYFREDCFSWIPKQA